MLGMLLVVAACGGGDALPSASAADPTTAASASGSPIAAGSPEPTATEDPAPAGPVTLTAREFDVVDGSHPHDVAPALDGGVWYTGQHDGTLGHLDPGTGDVRTIRLGAGSAPHGVITGPDGNAWITDSGLDAIVKVDATTDAVTLFRLPAERRGANLNTAVFDDRGMSCGSTRA